MKKFLVLVAGVAIGWFGNPAVADLVNDPVPYTLGCFQPDRAARSLCHRTLDIAAFRNELGAVLSDPHRLAKEGHSFVRGLEMMMNAGISPHEIGIDTETLNLQIEYAQRFSRGNVI